MNTASSLAPPLNSPSPPRHLFRGAAILPGTAGRTSCAAACACCASQAEGPTTAGVTGVTGVTGGGSGRQKEALAKLGCETWLENHRFLNGGSCWCLARKITDFYGSWLPACHV